MNQPPQTSPLSASADDSSSPLWPGCWDHSSGEVLRVLPQESLRHPPGTHRDLSFPIMYPCQAGFSLYASVKRPYCNTLNTEADTEIQLSFTKTDIAKVLWKLQTTTLHNFLENIIILLFIIIMWRIYHVIFKQIKISSKFLVFIANMVNINSPNLSKKREKRKETLWGPQ